MEAVDTEAAKGALSGAACFSGGVSEALTLSARQAQLLLQKLQTAEATLEEERHLGSREREVMAERLRFAQSEDEAARERLARALASLRWRARDEAAEVVSDHQLRGEETLARLQEECRQLKVSQEQSEQEAAALRHVQREQQAQLALVNAERERLSQEVKELKAERMNLELQAAEKESGTFAVRKLTDEKGERVSQEPLEAVERSEEKGRDQRSRWGSQTPSRRFRAPAAPVGRTTGTSWVSPSATGVWSKSPASLQANPDMEFVTRPPQMLELRCQELQSRLERALVQAESSRQRTLELELQLECERGDARTTPPRPASAIALAPALSPSPVGPGELEMQRKAARMEAEMNAARAQAQAAKKAEESALEALSDSERRCRDGLRRMDAMLADTKELTRELAKHKYLAEGMDSMVRRHEVRMLRPSPEIRSGTSTPVAPSGRRRNDFGRFTASPTRMIREPIAVQRITHVPGGFGGETATSRLMGASFLSDPGTSRFGRSPSPPRRPEVEPQHWRGQ